MHGWPPELLYQLGIGVEITVGDPDVDDPTECPACGFDAVVTFPIYLLAPSGVSRMRDLDWTGCVRCWAENNPDS